MIKIKIEWMNLDGAPQPDYWINGHEWEVSRMAAQGIEYNGFMKKSSGEETHIPADCVRLVTVLDDAV